MNDDASGDSKSENSVSPLLRNMYSLNERAREHKYTKMILQKAAADSAIMDDKIKCFDPSTAMPPLHIFIKIPAYLQKANPFKIKMNEIKDFEKNVMQIGIISTTAISSIKFCFKTNIKELKIEESTIISERKVRFA